MVSSGPRDGRGGSGVDSEGAMKVDGIVDSMATVGNHMVLYAAVLHDVRPILWVCCLSA
jgi:hypothetical protein